MSECTITMHFCVLTQQLHLLELLFSFGKHFQCLGDVASDVLEYTLVYFVHTFCLVLHFVEKPDQEGSSVLSKVRGLRLEPRAAFPSATFPIVSFNTFPFQVDLLGCVCGWECKLLKVQSSEKVGLRINQQHQNHNRDADEVLHRF